MSALKMLLYICIWGWVNYPLEDSPSEAVAFPGSYPGSKWHKSTRSLEKVSNQKI